MRLIDGDAFAEFIERTSQRQDYGDLKIDDTLTVADVLKAVVADLKGMGIDGFANAPTIEHPEIVRCRECIWWKNGDCQNLRGLYHPKGEGFCSMAERKEDPE